MPRLNRLGQWCAGIGANEVTAQPYGPIAAPAGAADWKDDQTVVFSRRVALPDTWALAERSTTGVKNVSPGGAQWIEAGGGLWAAGIGGAHPTVWTSDGRTFPGAAILCVGDDGTMVMRPDYFKEPARIVYRDGRKAEDLTFTCLSPHRVGNAMVYVDGSGQVRSWNLRQPVTAPGLAYHPRLLTFPDGSRWLLVVRTEPGRERLLLHPWDSLEGYVLAEAVANLPTYRPDGIMINKTPVVAYATNKAETHDSIMAGPIDLTKPRVDLSVPFAPAVVAIGRPMACGFFNFTPADTPGNVRLNVSDLIVRGAGGQALAIYCAGAPDETNIGQIEAAIIKAQASGLPVVAYWPHQAHAGRVPIGAEFVGVEAYRLKGESLAAFETRIGIVLERCPKAAIIAQCYTSNATLDSDLKALVPVYARLAKAHANVWGLLAFSGSGRATGLQDHPEVRPLWVTLAAGIPSAPTEEFMDPWRIKFDESYTKTIARGAGAVARCGIGNGLEVEWQKGADDTIHFAVYKDGTLQDRSGSPRHVEVRG